MIVAARRSVPVLIDAGKFVVLILIVADGLEVTDEVVERGIFADVDEILDASRHGSLLSPAGN